MMVSFRKFAIIRFTTVLFATSFCIQSLEVSAFFTTAATKTKIRGSATAVLMTTRHWPNDKQPLEGIVPPLVTPLLLQQDATMSIIIDQDGTRRLIDHVIDGGVNGVFILGTTGEFPSLNHSVKRQFIHLCCELVKERVPVLVGITDTCLSETLQLAKVAKEAGANAVVLTTPYYFPMEQNELLQYVKLVVAQIDLPLVLYNMPGLARNHFAIDTVDRLMRQEPRIAGIKDSSGDLDYFAQLCQLKQQLKAQRPDWTVMMGPEHLLADAIRLGADGGVNGGANVEPTLFVEACKAAFAKKRGIEKEEDSCKLSRLMNRVNAFQEIYKVGTPGFRFVTATKCALSLQGICSDAMASPFENYNQQEREQVKTILKKLPCLD